MGTYLNPSNFNFERCLNSKIYVDKSGLISFTNSILGTEQGFICVSRPRRFGKTMAADMLAAYYGSGEDSDKLFEGLEIKEDESYEKYLNKYQEDKTVSIPNKEVAEEFLVSIEAIDSYSEVFELIQQSRELIESLWNQMENNVDSVK